MSSLFLQIDERIFELVQDLRDAVILAALVRKCELNQKTKFPLSYRSFEIAFRLTPYESRTALQRLSRWVTVTKHKSSKYNILTVNLELLYQDLETTHSNLGAIYFPTWLSSIEPEPDPVDFYQEVTVTSAFNDKKISQKTSTIEKEFSNQNQTIGQKFYNQNPTIEQNFHNQNPPKNKKFEDNAENFLEPSINRTYLVKNKKLKQIKNNKAATPPLPEEFDDDSSNKVTVTSTTANSGQSYSKSKQVCSAETVNSLPEGKQVCSADFVVGSLSLSCLYNLMKSYWEACMTDQGLALQDLIGQIDQLPMSGGLKEILKTFAWWFPANPLMSLADFRKEWFDPLVQFAANPIPFKYFSSKFLDQWEEISNPSRDRRYYMLTPRGSWAYMGRAITQYLQSRKRGGVDAWEFAPNLPTNFDEFRKFVSTTP